MLYCYCCTTILILLTRAPDLNCVGLFKHKKDIGCSPSFRVFATETTTLTLLLLIKKLLPIKL